MDLVFMTPSTSLRTLELIDRLLSSRDSCIASLFPNLEEFDFTLFPDEPATWSLQEQETALTEAVEQLTFLRTLSVKKLVLSPASFIRIGQHRRLMRLECTLGCMTNLDRHLRACPFPLLQYLHMDIDSLESLNSILSLITSSQLKELSCVIVGTDVPRDPRETPDQFPIFVQRITRPPFLNSLVKVGIFGICGSSNTTSDRCLAILYQLRYILSLNTFIFLVENLQLEEADFLALWSSLPYLQVLRLSSPIFISLCTMKSIFQRLTLNPRSPHELGVGLIIDETWTEADIPTTALSNSFSSLVITPFSSTNTLVVARIIAKAFPSLEFLCMQSKGQHFSSGMMRRFDYAFDDFMPYPIWRQLEEHILVEQERLTGKRSLCRGLD
jgi:hypothetical protein